MAWLVSLLGTSGTAAAAGSAASGAAGSSLMGSALTGSLGSSLGSSIGSYFGGETGAAVGQTLGGMADKGGGGGNVNMLAGGLQEAMPRPIPSMASAPPSRGFQQAGGMNPSLAYLLALAQQNRRLV